MPLVDPEMKKKFLWPCIIGALIDAPVRKAFFWPCVVGVLIAIGYGSCLRPRLPVNLHGRAAANSSGRLVVICMGGWL